MLRGKLLLLGIVVALGVMVAAVYQCTSFGSATTRECVLQAGGSSPYLDLRELSAAERGGALRLRILTDSAVGSVALAGRSVAAYFREIRAWVECGRGSTDADGYVSLDDLPLSAMLDIVIGDGASSSGYIGSFFAAAGDGDIQTVRLRPSRTVRGRVVSQSSGEAVAGATIWSMISGPFVWHSRYFRPSPGIHYTSTGGDGQFAISTEGDLLFVSAPGFAPSRILLRAPCEPVVRLAFGASLAGRVAMSEGESTNHVLIAACPAGAPDIDRGPVDRWWLEHAVGCWVRPADETQEEVHAVEWGSTDAGGNFRLDGLRPESEYAVWAIAEGRISSPVQLVSMPGAGETLRLYLLLHR